MITIILYNKYLYSIRSFGHCIALIIGFMFCATLSDAEELSQKQLAELVDGPWEFAGKHVREQREFYGLASYYNNLLVLLISDDIYPLKSGESFVLGEEHTLVIVGRFKVLTISGSGLAGVISEDGALRLQPNKSTFSAVKLRKNELASLGGQFDAIRYYHLWAPLAWMARAAESILVFTQSHVVSSWGVAILLFTVFIKIILLPLSFYSVAEQRRVSILKSNIEPQLGTIKKFYDGEDAHNRMMAVYKEEGVTPFYSLKPLLVSLVQIPVVVAVFNALGEMPQLSGASFLWVGDLVYPDSIGRTASAIPFLGAELSVLPWLMTAVTVVAALLFKDPYASPLALSSQRRNLYFMALTFFVLFYPFPAAMVLFWTGTSLMQMMQQQLMKI